MLWVQGPHFPVDKGLCCRYEGERDNSGLSTVLSGDWPLSCYGMEKEQPWMGGVNVPFHTYLGRGQRP